MSGIGIRSELLREYDLRPRSTAHRVGVTDDLELRKSGHFWAIHEFPDIMN